MIDLVEDTSGVIIELLATLGSRDTSRMSHQQFDAELLFKLLDLLTERRLSNAKYLCRTRNIAAFENLHEVTKLTKIHLGGKPLASCDSSARKLSGSQNLLPSAIFISRNSIS